MIEDILWGLWNGLTAWPLLIFQVFGIWDQYPVYNVGRDGGWYVFGFLLGWGRRSSAFWRTGSHAVEHL
jgi:hypothetical protein